MEMAISSSIYETVYRHEKPFPSFDTLHLVYTFEMNQKKGHITQIVKN